MHKKTGVHVIGWLILLAGLLFTTGCPAYHFLGINYYFARSTFGSDLYVLVVYDGIYAGIKPPPPPSDPTSSTLKIHRPFLSFGDNPYSTQSETEQIANALKELNDTLVDQGEACIVDSNYGISQPMLEESLQRAEKDKKEKPEAYASAQYLAKNYEVRFGGFFRETHTNRLFAYQIVRFRGVRKLISLANAAIAAERNDNFGCSDEESKRIPKTIQLTQNKKHQWVTLDGSAFQFHIPVAPEEAPQVRAIFWERIFKCLPSEGIDAKKVSPATTLWSPPPVSMRQSQREISFQIGDSEQKMNQIELSGALTEEDVKKYSDNLLEFVSKQSNWKDKLDAETLVQEFEKSPAALFKRLPVCVPPKKENPQEKR
ncbi:TPA: hypothetical protein DDW35_10875 [Candidatus Sumerlaeota bacterium]|jgi:hypothetical protein|nr:hypothetical protein [Candidatus Sumerlaeota bacterium]